MLKVQLEIPQIPHNLFGPSAQIGELFGIFLKALITCPLSMDQAIQNADLVWTFKVGKSFPWLSLALCTKITYLFTLPFQFSLKRRLYAHKVFIPIMCNKNYAYALAYEMSTIRGHNLMLINFLVRTLQWCTESLIFVYFVHDNVKKNTASKNSNTNIILHSTVTHTALYNISMLLLRFSHQFDRKKNCQLSICDLKSWPKWFPFSVIHPIIHNY